MLNQKNILKAGVLLVAVMFGGLAFEVGAQTQAPAQNVKPAPTPAVSTPRSQPARLDKHAVAYYASVWGIEEPSVKWAEAGELIRFSYRVLDPDKAKILNDKSLEPSLIDAPAHVKLVVPSMDNVGMLRQAGTPVAGRVYWMAFSNSGRPVKRGDRVDVVIGNFHASGLIVE